MPAPKEPSPLTLRVATAIREARERKGWTQAQLDREIRLPTKTTQRVEAGTNEPGIDTIASMAVVLGLSLDVIFDLKPPAAEMAKLYTAAQQEALARLQAAAAESEAAVEQARRLGLMPRPTEEPSKKPRREAR